MKETHSDRSKAFRPLHAARTAARRVTTIDSQEAKRRQTDQVYKPDSKATKVVEARQDQRRGFRQTAGLIGVTVLGLIGLAAANEVGANKVDEPSLRPVVAEAPAQDGSVAPPEDHPAVRLPVDQGDTFSGLAHEVVDRGLAPADRVDEVTDAMLAANGGSDVIGTDQSVTFDPDNEHVTIVNDTPPVQQSGE